MIEKSTATIRAAIMRASASAILRFRNAGSDNVAPMTRNNVAVSGAGVETGACAEDGSNQPMSLSLGKASHLKKLTAPICSV